MKYLSIASISLFAALLFVSPAAAGQWESVSEGDIQSIYGIVEKDDVYVATGNTGKHIYSTDEGVTWQEGATGANTFFMDIGLLHDGRVFTAGEQGISLTSEDKGKTWSQISFGTDKLLLDIDTTSEAGYIVGNSGTILSYAPATDSWNSTGPTGESEHFHGAHVQSQMQGWVVGTSSRIYFTNNGGVAWTRVFTSTPNETHKGVVFVDDGTGFIVGTNGLVIKTTNGGTEWETDSITGIGNIDLHSIASHGSKLAIAGEQVLATSDDKGETWDVESFAGTNKEFFNVYYDDDGTLWAVGTDFGVKSLVYKFTADAAPEPPEAPEGLKTESEASDTTPTFTWSIQNDVTEVYARIDDATFESIGLVTDYTASELDSGTHSFEIYAVGENGLSSTVEKVTFTVDEQDNTPAEASQSTLVKIACTETATASDPCKAVYYYADDGKRHAFPNEKVFFTWFDDFDDVVEVSADFMKSLPLGKNVTYRPGVKMVKFLTVKTVYAVAPSGVLRAIDSEEVAKGLYGSDWNKQIDDISDAFFGNYSFGDAITDAVQFDPSAEKSSANKLDANF